MDVTLIAPNLVNIIATVVNILVLYWIFKKFLYKPVMKVITDREEMIQSQFDQAAKDQEDAENLKSEYEKKLDDAKIEADQIILNARDRAEAEHAKAVEDTRLETEAMKEKAKADIATDQEKATKAAEAQVAQLAFMAARKIMESGDVNDAGSGK